MRISNKRKQRYQREISVSSVISCSSLYPCIFFSKKPQRSYPTTLSHFFTLGSEGPLRLISKTAAFGITTAGPSRCNKSSSPTRANRITGEALTTHSETTPGLLREFFHVDRIKSNLGPSGRFKEIAVPHPRQPGCLTRGEFAAATQGG